MNPKYVRIVAVALALLVALAFVIGLIVPLITPSAKAEGTLDELRDNARELAEAKKQIQQQLGQLASDKATAIQKKEALDHEIELTSAEVDNTIRLIDQLTHEIADRQTALDEAMREEARQLENFRVRIRLMEESGEVEYLGVLLQADSFPDLLGRLSSVQDIMDYDQKILAQLRAVREKVDAEKKALEQYKAEQDQVRAELSDRQTELEAQEAEQQRLIDEIHAQEAELRKAEEEQEKQEQQIQDDIQKELKRLEEEEKKRQQEQNQPQVGTQYVGGEFAWPCPSSYKVTSPFGNRYHPILHYNRMHTGVDIGASSGSKILAANAGTVIKSDYNGGGYGNYVVIDHGGGRATLYAHMSRRLAEVGQTVARGETIGLVGSTGLSTGPHLHYEVIINGTQVNPMQFYK